jgi:RNA polymerase sigma factor (TIGR02999 family)
MTNVTRILSGIEDGDASAAEVLLQSVYEELRKLAAAKMAKERPGQTLQPTALVSEAWIRLVDPREPKAWKNRGHFFAAAAEAMRRILIDRARDKGRLKRGGGQNRVDFDSIEVAMDTPSEDLLAVNEAIEKLATKYPDDAYAELVKLRFFAGMTHAEAAAALGIPKRTADRDWDFARAWLRKCLASDNNS